MTEKFDAFKTALHALCVEHGVNLHGKWVDYEDFRVQVEPATETRQAGCDLEIECVILPTPEEISAEEARNAAALAEWNAKWAGKWDGSYMKHHFALLDSMSLEEKQAMIAVTASEQRKNNMRVTRTPGDPNDIGERPCRVWCNEAEITDWTAADDFRRVVETPDGPRFGSVRIDVQPQECEPAEEAATHLCGMFVPEPKPEAPAIEIIEAAPEPAPVKTPPHVPARAFKAGRK